MKIFQKTGVAVLVMCIAIAAAVGIGLWRQPAAAVGSQTGSLDTGLDTTYYAKFVDDRADLLSSNAEETIALAKSLVRPGGVLLLAADNPLGLKHWAGAPAEAGAMGRTRLLELLPGAECYYPLPDYRAASEIYSDGRLPGKGDLTGMVISYDYPQFLRTDVGASWDKICQEGSFREFANSYLMVWRRHG